MNRFVSWGASTTWAEVYRALPSIEAAWHGRATGDSAEELPQGLAEEEAVADPDGDEQESSGRSTCSGGSLASVWKIV